MIDAPISPDILEETLKRNQDTEIVTLLAERLNIDAEEALRIYYSSRLAEQINEGRLRHPVHGSRLSRRRSTGKRAGSCSSLCKITRENMSCAWLWSHDTR